MTSESLRPAAVWLAELNHLAERFRQLLEAEIRHLSGWPVLSLPDFADAKLALAGELEALERERCRWLQAHGQPDAGNQAMHAALAPEEDSPRLIAIWEQAMAALKACQPLNQQAGLSIQLLARQTRRSLDILSGGASLPATYGPAGHQNASYPRHRLGQA